MISQLGSTAQPGRYTFGLLSEFTAYESESQLFLGAQEAAQALDVNLLYIVPLSMDDAIHYGDFDPQSPEAIREKHRQLKAYLDACQLDGLIYIGWSRAFQGEEGDQLRALLHPLPLISITTNSPDTPAVEMPGHRYIEEAVRHLITEHGCRSIAYVSSWKQDTRLEGYARAMRDHRLYDEELIVQVEELASTGTLDERMARAAAILLDERKKPVDAIILLTAFDTKFMLEVLEKRQLRVPEDIALISYEDHPVIEFAEPSMTTIYFPFFEIGYEACRKLFDSVNGIVLPPVSEIGTRIIYRDSCGCTVNKVKPMQLGQFPTPPNDGSSPRERLSPARIASLMPDEMGLEVLDYERLAATFLTSLEQGSGPFLEALGQELEKLKNRYIPGVPNLLDRLRTLIMPHVEQDRGLYERAEAVWFGARYIVKDYENTASLKQYIRSNELNKINNFINQRLLPARSLSDVASVLNDYLGWIAIPTVYLLMQDGSRDRDKLRMFFAHDNYCMVTDEYPAEATIAEYYAAFRRKKDVRFSGYILPLRVNDEMLGYAIIEPGTHGTTPVLTLLEQVGNAVKGAQVQEESREKEAQLAYYADMDSLTGLFNRRTFYDALSSIQLSREAFSVLYIDIDGFKQVNDQQGHDAGDLLLVQIADRLREVLQGAAFAMKHTVPSVGETMLSSIHRLGGDEFTAILTISRPDELASYGARLCEALGRPYSLNGRIARVTASIGIARYPEDSVQLEQLLKFADLALYSAKGQKNRSIFYHELQP
jgi:diguanylate cyclase (GGDEF)-like protein